MRLKLPSERTKNESLLYLKNTSLNQFLEILLSIRCLSEENVNWTETIYRIKKVIASANGLKF